MAKEDIEILTSELSLFKKVKDDSDDIQLNVIVALNNVISSGHELLELKKGRDIPEAGDTTALSTLFDSAGARVSRNKDAIDALVDSRKQAVERVKQAERELEAMPQESSTVASKWPRKKSQTKPTDVLEKARSALALIDINLETAEEKHGDAEARLNELLTQHHAQIKERRVEIKERQEMVAQATQRYDHMKEAYIAAAAAAAAAAPPATATAATTTAVSDPTATLAAAAAQVVTAAHQGVFAPLTLVDTDAKDVSRHESGTAKAVYTFIHDPRVKSAVSSFQKKCLRNPKVAGFIVAPAPLDSDRLEDDFATRLVRTLAPRVEVVLTEVLGLTDVTLKKLSRTYGVDMTLSALDPHDVRHPLILPIEVKGYFGSGNAHASTETNLNYRTNARCFRSLCKDLAHRNPLNIWKAVTQTAWYIQNEANSNNRGVVFFKDGVLLLYRLNHDTVLVSGLIEYGSVDPHPVAALAFWIQESVLSPSRVLNPDYPDTVSIQPAAGTGASTRSESGSPGGGSGPSGGSGLGRSGGSTPRKRSRLAKEYRMPSYDDDDNGDFQPDNRGQKKGKERQYGEYPTDVEHDLLHNSSTTAVDAGMKRFSTYMHTLGTFVDTSSAELEFVGSSRCGKVYVGDLGDGQPVVIKAAPADNDQNLDELNTEIRAYYRLSDLQGKVVPRVIAHGHCHIDGKLVGILAVERIEGEAILPPLDMDVRAALTELSDAERLACKDALAAIHKRGVAHGDVRGANLLFRRNHDGNALEPVFIDFGFSRFDTDAKFKETVKEDKLRLLDAFCGSSIYF